MGLAYYDLCVKPYRDLVVEARREIFTHRRTSREHEPIPLRTSLIALAVAFITALGFLIHYPAPILCLVVGGVYIYITSSLPCFTKRDYWRYLHYGFSGTTILVSVLILTLADFKSDWGGYATATGIFLSLDIGLIITRLNSDAS